MYMRVFYGSEEKFEQSTLRKKRNQGCSRDVLNFFSTNLPITGTEQ